MNYTGYSFYVYCWMVLALAVWLVLNFVTAPYGRHATDKWGPQVNNKLGWVLMELPVMIVLCWFVIPVFSQLSVVTRFMIGLFMFHYINRTLIFPFRLRTGKKTMPFIIVLSGIAFNILNGAFLGYYFSSFATYTDRYVFESNFIIGLIVFFCGMYINWRADTYLINLRKGVTTGYVIPEGWLFKYVSCPNLLGEIIEWAGFAILCWCLPATAFFVWTVANLLPRAVAHHKWYQHRFENYPGNRKAIIPFLY